MSKRVGIPLVGQLEHVSTCYFRVEQMVHTLAMPIGEADSAIVNGVYVSTAEMAGWCGIGAERWREDGRGSF